MRDGKRITLIAAMARNRGIGRDGELPWHLPRELRHFKEATMGKPIVMGRRTWESIGRPLPGRQNLVLTSHDRLQPQGCQIAGSFDEALDMAEGPEVMIIGGGQLYAQTLEFADRMVLTLVDCEPEADTFFPEWPAEEWQETARRTERADDRNEYDYVVIELARR